MTSFRPPAPKTFINAISKIDNPRKIVFLSTVFQKGDLLNLNFVICSRVHNICIMRCVLILVLCQSTHMHILLIFRRLSHFYRLKQPERLQIVKARAHYSGPIILLISFTFHCFIAFFEIRGAH